MLRFSLFFFSVKSGPLGCLQMLVHEMQTRLQKAEEQLKTLPCKMHGCFTEKMFSTGF